MADLYSLPTSEKYIKLTKKYEKLKEKAKDIGLLVEVIDVMGSVDFITTMGAGCHAHPGGTKAGAAALVQSCEAYLKKIDINKYAKNHIELAEAIKFFSKKVKQAESS